jgi:hypothetical protein
VAAAALGRTTLRVRRPPRVTVVLTGTEVVPAGQPPPGTRPPRTATPWSPSAAPPSDGTTISRRSSPATAT